VITERFQGKCPKGLKMAHEGWDKRFVIVGQPAWHKLGWNPAAGTIVLAKEAFDRQPFQVVMTPVRTDISTPVLFGESAKTLELNYKALIRLPGATWDAECFGIVGPDYHLIDPERMCALWDIAAGNAGIETYGVLNEGRELFITQRLPNYDVMGDECVNHICLHSPWDGKRGIRVFETPTRVVCANTLNLGIQTAGAMFMLRHVAGSEPKLVKWLAEMHAQALTKAGEIQAALTKLALTRVKQEDIDALLAGIMPLPSMPRPTPDKEENAKKLKWWESACASTKKRRSAVRVLFDGAGIGMDTKACAGSAFGFFNAVAEFCDHGQANKSTDPKREHSREYDTLFGVRAEYKADAYDTLWTYATTGKVPEMAIVR
jgi:phage/plasmid-like protein (TIGR03299 family)